MAAGVVHRRANRLLSPLAGLVVGAGVLLRFDEPVWGLIALVGGTTGCWLSSLIDPDLDQEGVTGSEWELIHATLLFGFVWLAVFYPYAMALDHREWRSHLPVVGTLLRVAYLGIWGGLAWAFATVPHMWVVLALGLPVLYAMLCVPALWQMLVLASGVGLIYVWLGLGPRAQVATGALVAGLAIGDTMHWFLDGCPLN